ncbi:hypothetical protein BGZ83_004565 [Gryganskiella cystojenkinii]|nr:hypothetical protein BGZ83_004565 [Gryganskiella cystojenkinii]
MAALSLVTSDDRRTPPTIKNSAIPTGVDSQLHEHQHQSSTLPGGLGASATFIMDLSSSPSIDEDPPDNYGNDDNGGVGGGDHEDEDEVDEPMGDDIHSQPKQEEDSSSSSGNYNRKRFLVHGSQTIIDVKDYHDLYNDRMLFSSSLDSVFIVLQLGIDARLQLPSDNTF